jgi:hypothetical protein
MRQLLHTTVTALFLMMFFSSGNAYGQPPIQYNIADIEYNYVLKLENVSDPDQAKLPISLLQDFFNARPYFQATSNQFQITSRKNYSKIELELFLADYDLFLIDWKKHLIANNNAEDKE